MGINPAHLLREPCTRRSFETTSRTTSHLGNAGVVPLTQHPAHSGGSPWVLRVVSGAFAERYGVNGPHARRAGAGSAFCNVRVPDDFEVRWMNVLRLRWKRKR